MYITPENYTSLTLSQINYNNSKYEILKTYIITKSRRTIFLLFQRNLFEHN